MPYLAFLLVPVPFLPLTHLPLRCSFCSFFNNLVFATCKTLDSSFVSLPRTEAYEEGFSLTLLFGNNFYILGQLELESEI